MNRKYLYIMFQQVLFVDSFCGVIALTAMAECHRRIMKAPWPRSHLLSAADGNRASRYATFTLT